MAGSVFKKNLIHTATVQRATLAQDSVGELIPTWADNGTIDCRFVAKSERIADEAVGLQMLESYLLLCNNGEDVFVDDRIANIILKSTGGTVDPGPFTIEAELSRNSTKPHHISLTLERVE